MLACFQTRPILSVHASKEGSFSCSRATLVSRAFSACPSGGRREDDAHVPRKGRSPPLTEVDQRGPQPSGRCSVSSNPKDEISETNFSSSPNKINFHKIHCSEAFSFRFLALCCMNSVSVDF